MTPEDVTGPPRLLALEPMAADPEVGRWLAALEDGRRETLRELDSVTPEMIDWHHDGPLESIGTLLYHIALIEAAWLLDEIMDGHPGPDWLPATLPVDDRDSDGRLSRVVGEPLAVHLERLAAVRGLLAESLGVMTAFDYHRPRRLADYDAAPDWVVHHLLQHEAEHRAHIALLRDTFPGPTAR
jgi:hypothetical protein